MRWNKLPDGRFGLDLAYGFRWAGTLEQYRRLRSVISQVIAGIERGEPCGVAVVPAEAGS